MHKFFRAALWLFVVGFSVTACSSGSPAPPTANSPSNLSLRSSVPQTLPGQLLDFPAAKSPKVKKIFVAEFSGNGGPGAFQVFNPSGQVIGGSSASGSNPQDLALDASGRHLYVAQFGRNILVFDTKYPYHGVSTITLADRAIGIALGPDGKIYVSLYYYNKYPTGTVITFDKSGKQIKPTIMGTGAIGRVAVDAAGKIYVTNSDTNTLHTYLPNGKPTTPTITAGLSGPGPVRVDGSGKIYVGNGTGNSITTYNPDGTQTTPTIAVNSPDGLGLAANGNIYVTDSTDNSALAFNAVGTPIAPTITGLPTPTGIAVLNSR